MKAVTREIVDELINAGLIKDESDLTANDKTNFIFDYMVRKYSYLLQNDEETIMPDDCFRKGKIMHEIIVNFGKYFLKNPQIIENRYELLAGDSETFSDRNRESMKSTVTLPDGPVIFLSNHGFKDDVLATIIAAKRRAFIVFGSLPQFYGTVDGLLSAKNGVVMVNRKVSKSKSTSVAKGKYALEHGVSLMICPEGVWNKSPNMPMLNFWDGFHRIAKKDDGTYYPIVPIVHYISNTHKPGKDNPIHTVVDDPIILDGMTDEEAMEYVNTRMVTWYWKLMEKFGFTTRDELLNNYSNMTEAWEDELEKRVATADKYDYEIEISADRRKEIDPIKVWEPIANLETTKENALEVTKAKVKVKELKSNDFQHRF